VSFHLRCPSERTVAASLAAAQHQSLTYQPIGLSLAPRVGYWTDDAGAVIGQGDAAFARARRALEQWQQFDLGWTQVFPKSAAIVEGTVVVVRVRHLRFWSLNPCRIVSTRETAHEFSFAYGTLPTHANRVKRSSKSRSTPPQATCAMTSGRYHARRRCWRNSAGQSPGDGKRAFATTRLRPCGVRSSMTRHTRTDSIAYPVSPVLGRAGGFLRLATGGPPP